MIWVCGRRRSAGLPGRSPPGAEGPAPYPPALPPALAPQPCPGCRERKVQRPRSAALSVHKQPRWAAVSSRESGLSMSPVPPERGALHEAQPRLCTSAPTCWLHPSPLCGLVSLLSASHLGVNPKRLQHLDSGEGSLSAPQVSTWLQRGHRIIIRFMTRCLSFHLRT